MPTVKQLQAQLKKAASDVDPLAVWVEYVRWWQNRAGPVQQLLPVLERCAHHFKDDVPTYLALSGATQTGPNTFWTKTALQYAKTTAL